MLLGVRRHHMNMSCASRGDKGGHAKCGEIYREIGNVGNNMNQCRTGTETDGAEVDMSSAEKDTNVRVRTLDSNTWTSVSNIRTSGGHVTTWDSKTRTSDSNTWAQGGHVRTSGMRRRGFNSKNWTAGLRCTTSGVRAPILNLQIWLEDVQVQRLRAEIPVRYLHVTTANLHGRNWKVKFALCENHHDCSDCG